jgi:hypothetical protein
MNLFFWTLLNLGVPIAGPIFMLALVVPTHGWHVAKALIAASVKDGQLFWCAMGLCAAAVYEAMTALELGRGAVPVLEIAIAAFCMLAFVCSNVVMLLLVSAHDDPMVDGTRAGQKRFVTGSRPHGVATAISILATSLAAISFAILHVRLI